MKALLSLTALAALAAASPAADPSKKACDCASGGPCFCGLDCQCPQHQFTLAKVQIPAPDAPQLNFSSFEKRLTDLEHRVAAIEQKATTAAPAAPTGTGFPVVQPYTGVPYQTTYYPPQQVFYPQQTFYGGDFGGGGACAGGNCGGGQRGYHFAPFGGRFRVFR
jgi:hypothetical protein